MITDEALLKKHKQFFGYIDNKESKNPITYFYIECDKGWNKLLDICFNKIKLYCEQNKLNYPQVTQIKEKFGGLRLYIDTVEDDYIYDIISETENKSYKVCEICGKEGKLRKGGWLKTLCEKCNEK